MRTLAENFFNPSFGIMADVVHIVAVKTPIFSPGDVVGRGYTNAANANANLL
jgi:hypothetical protein